MQLKAKLREIYGKDRDAYNYMAYVILGWSICDCFSRVSKTWENARLTWSLYYVFVTAFAIGGLLFAAGSMIKLCYYARNISRGASMKCIRIPFDDDCP